MASTHGRSTSRRHGAGGANRRSHGPSFVGPPRAGDEYYGNGQVVLEQAPPGYLPPASVGSGELRGGSLILSKFTQDIRPPVIVGSLPALPDVTFPIGSTVVLTTDGKLYRNVAGSWTALVATSDLAGLITETQITDGAITTPKMTANTIDGDRILAGTLAASKIEVDSITAGQIAVGAIGASEILAGAVTAEKALFGRSRNALIDNPDFEHGPVSQPATVTGWTFTPGTGGDAYMTSGGGIAGRYAVITNGAGGFSKIRSSHFPVVAGDRVHVSLWAQRFVGLASIGAYVEFLDVSLGFISFLPIAVVDPVPAAWARYNSTVSVPSTAVYARVYIETAYADTSLVVDEVQVVRSNDTVTADGSVVIDSVGITVTNGRITVKNAGGTVVIDGTSNMFKILAQGEFVFSGVDGSGAGGGVATSTTTLALGINYTPVFVGLLETALGGDAAARTLPRILFDVSNGFASSGLVVDNYFMSAVDDLGSGNIDVVGHWETRANRAAATSTMSYSILKEQAF